MKNRRHAPLCVPFGTLLLALLALLAIVAVGHARTGSIAPRRIVFVLFDDVGVSELPHLPSLELVAAQGMTFTRAYGQPVCCVARYAALFGRYPRRDGIGDVELSSAGAGFTRLPLELVSLPERLAADGYVTGLIGKWHLGREPLFLSGARDTALGGPRAQGIPYWSGGTHTGLLGYYGWQRVTDCVQAFSSQYATIAQREEAISWLDVAPSPSLTLLWWNAAHAPYDIAPGYADDPSLRVDFEHIVDVLDRELALVLAELDLGQDLLIVASDNGTPNEVRPEGTPAGVWKATTFEGGVRVPLLVAGPGIQHGTSGRLVSLMDLPATIAGLLGLELEAGFEDSVSFADELGDFSGDAPRQYIFVERFNANADDRAVLEDTWKLRLFDPDAAGPLPVSCEYYAITSAGTDFPLTPPQAVKTRLLAHLAEIPARQ